MPLLAQAYVAPAGRVRRSLQKDVRGAYAGGSGDAMSRLLKHHPYRPSPRDDAAR